MEPERKEPEKESHKVANEASLKTRVPLVKVEEATVEEGTPVEPEDAPGKNQLACDRMWFACFALSFFLLFFFYTRPSPLIRNLEILL